MKILYCLFSSKIISSWQNLSLSYLRTVRKRLIIDVTIDTTRVQQSEIKTNQTDIISSNLDVECSEEA